MLLCTRDIEVACIIPKSDWSLYSSYTVDYKENLYSIKAENGSLLNWIQEGALSDFYTLKIVDLYNCNKLQSIPQDFCFYCINLETVILPEFGILNTIYGGAFSDVAIQNITFPSSLMYLYSHRSKPNVGSFSNCRRLENIFYYSENNLRIIEPYVFREPALKEFHIGPYLSEMTAVVFEKPSREFNKITINESNRYFIVYDNVLYDVDNNLIFCPPAYVPTKLLNTTLTIKSEAFTNNIMVHCNFLPDSLERIEGFCFVYCDLLKTITIPKSVVIIKDYIFYWCSSLLKVIFPPNLEYIDQFTFMGCYKLRYLKLYDNITSVNENAFSDCSLKDCGIICSEKVQMIIQFYTNLDDNAFKLCPVPTPKPQKLLLRKKRLIFF